MVLSLLIKLRLEKISNQEKKYFLKVSN